MHPSAPEQAPLDFQDRRGSEGIEAGVLGRGRVLADSGVGHTALSCWVAVTRMQGGRPSPCPDRHGRPRWDKSALGLTGTESPAPAPGQSRPPLTPRRLGAGSGWRERLWGQGNSEKEVAVATPVTEPGTRGEPVERGAREPGGPYPFSRVTHLARGTHRPWRSWEALELEINSEQSSERRHAAPSPGASPDVGTRRRTLLFRREFKGVPGCPPQRLPHVMGMKVTLTAGPSGPGGPSKSMPWKEGTGQGR